MNFLFDIGHPAHVHLFKNYIFYLKSHGHNITVASRRKDVTTILLDHYKIDHYPLSSPEMGLKGMAAELLSRNRQIYDLHRKKKFDAAIGTSVSIGFLKRKYGVPAYNFNEDDDNVVKLYSWLAYPHADKIINPDCIKFKRWKNKRILYPSYHELAYLHPSNFTPDKSVLKSYNLTQSRYVITRLSALQAHHDAGMKGISSELLSRIRSLLDQYQILESHELKKNNVKPWDMHHLLANARMIISDSQTMTIEGSVLGVPSVRINTFIDKSTVITELEKKYKLAFGFYPSEENEIIETIRFLSEEPEVKKIWNDRKSELLRDKIDFSSWIIEFFNKELSI